MTSSSTFAAAMLLLTTAAPACAQRSGPASAATGGAESVIAITHVAVLDVEAGRLDADRTILVRGDRIAWVGAAADADPRGVTREVAGDGLVAMPGLVDLHVHVDSTDLALFLPTGVTTVREMNGSDAHLRWRAALRSGRMSGPTLFVASPLLAGEQQRWRHVLVTSPEQAHDTVPKLIAEGYDYLKIYDGLSLPTWQAIVEEAGRAGIPIDGHIPVDVGLDRALAAGQTIEHIEQLTRAAAGHDPDAARAPEIAARVAAAGVAVTPTLAAMEILSRAGTVYYDSLFQRPQMTYADPSLLGWWASLRRSPPAPEARPRGVAMLDFMRTLTRDLDRAGVPILVGTDTPNPLLVPGFSLHHEMAALERAGIPRVRVLRAATLGAAEFLGVDDDVGAVRPGLRADLLLVRGNPLESLENAGRIETVVARGNVLDRARLDAMLAELERARAAAARQGG